MSYYSFRPRKTFNADLARLGKLDPSIIDDIHEAIDILLNGTYGQGNLLLLRLAYNPIDRLYPGLNGLNGIMFTFQ